MTRSEDEAARLGGAGDLIALVGCAAALVEADRELDDIDPGDDTRRARALRRERRAHLSALGAHIDGLRRSPGPSELQMMQVLADRKKGSGEQ